MTEILILINVVFAFLSYKWAIEAFNDGRNGWGWAMIVASAWNAAAFLNMVIV